MATKRDLASITDSAEHSASSCSPSQPSTKRARNNGNGPKNPTTKKQKQQQHEPATDVTYGQRCCFPGLGESVAHGSDEELDFEDETDALAYLQSVRQEASGIPHLLVAPRSGPQLPPRRNHDELGYDDNEPIDRSIYQDGRGDVRGYYKDGAYTAAPDPDVEAQQQQDPPTASPGNDAAARKALLETAYFASLTSSFMLLRGRLHQQPPPAAAARRPTASHVGRFGAQSKTFGVWSARLRSSDPAPAQVAAMTKDGVLRVLRVVLGGKFLRRGVAVRERTSRWVWALLARLPDRGELDYAEVGTVRELGKRAALLLWSLREMDLLREEVEGEGGGEEEGEVDLDLVGHGDGAGEEEWAGEDDDGGGQGEVELAEGELLDRGVPAGDPEVQAAPAQPISDPEPDPPSTTTTTTTIKPVAADSDMEDGEITDDTTSAPMDIEPPAPAPAPEEDIEAAKARLLANLEKVDGAAQEDGEVEDSDDPTRARMNMRLTLNMILTVAGEFYGQRDLLEFRDPFHGI